MSLATLPPNTDTGTPEGFARLSATLLHIITDTDRRDEARAARAKHGRGYHSPYALPIMIGAMNDALAEIKAGAPLRRTLLAHFNGRLVDRLLKACNLLLATRDEQRGYL